jgi:hypothetical protein
MRARALRGILLLAALAPACTVKPITSNTGYTGTWKKQGSSYYNSTISIVRVGEEHRFRWTLRSTDGSWKVACGWEGPCEEFVDGEKTSEYTFRAWIDPATSHLMVEQKGSISKPERLDLHRIDEWVLAADGKEASVYTNESMGQKFEGDHRPKFSFVKVADTVANPPVGAKS